MRRWVEGRGPHSVMYNLVKRLAGYEAEMTIIVGMDLSDEYGGVLANIP